MMFWMVYQYGFVYCYYQMDLYYYYLQLNYSYLCYSNYNYYHYYYLIPYYILYCYSQLNHNTSVPTLYIQPHITSTYSLFITFNYPYHLSHSHISSIFFTTYPHTTIISVFIILLYLTHNLFIIFCLLVYSSIIVSARRVIILCLSIFIVILCLIICVIVSYSLGTMCITSITIYSAVIILFGFGFLLYCSCPSLLIHSFICTFSDPIFISI